MEFADSFAWIYNHNKEIIGAGFLIGWQDIATCAHVVREALGLQSTPASAPKGDIALSFPFLKQDKLSATVLAEGWYHENDIALLQLNDNLPEGAQPANLSFDKVEKHSFSVYGFPGKITKGVWADGIIKKKREHGLVQLESASLIGYAVQGGFSGGPVFDDELNKVVGMVATSDRDVRVASMIPVDIISIGYSQAKKALISNTEWQDDTNNITQEERALIITEYIAAHKKTKTFQEQLVTFKEYKVKRKWCGLKTVFPNLPKADQEYYVLMMNFKGVHPRITDILTEKKTEISTKLKANELNSYLFVFIKINPQFLSIPSPNGGYRLGDGHIINAALDITYQVKNISDFWMSADDPLAMFQRAVINEARKYFFSITSEYLIRRPGDSKGDFESYILEHPNNDSETRKIKDILEKDIKAGCASSGIEITKVYADIQLSQFLSEHLQRLHERIYKKGGIHESYYSLQETALRRKQIDEVINSDPTFHPFNLKQVIVALDIGLIENFYNQSWAEAMQNVHDEIRRKKNSYLSDHKKMKIQGIRDLIQIAKEEKFEDVDVLQLRDKLLREMTIDQEHDSPLFSDKQFLQLVMTQQVESDISKKKTGQ